MQKVLFIWYKRSGAVKEGGALCSERNYAMVCKAVGAENVTSMYIHDDDKKRSIKTYAQALWRMPKGYYFGLTKQKAQDILVRAKEYDTVFIDRTVFGVLARDLKKAGYTGRIVAHYHNIEKVYFDAKLPKWLPFRQVLLRCVQKNDQWSAQYADKVIALNERDAEIIRQHYGRKVDLLVPIAMADQLTASPTERMTNVPLKCLTIGSYFAANNEGILWFVKNVLPRVKVEYTIVGKGMKKLKEDNSELLQGIEVVSDAPSLAPYFEEADVMILPIFSGSGMKVKTCECLMYGKNIVATDEALEGYHVEGDEIGGRCNSAEEFIQTLQAMTEHPRTRWNQYSREIFLKRYSLQAVEDLFTHILND